MTTSSEDVTCTPERTSKDATLHHSATRTNNKQLLEEGEKSKYVFRQLRANLLLVYAKGNSIKLVFDPDAKNQVKACAVNFFL